jgi:hypothetical protein
MKFGRSTLGDREPKLLKMPPGRVHFAATTQAADRDSYDERRIRMA